MKDEFEGATRVAVATASTWRASLRKSMEFLNAA